MAYVNVDWTDDLLLPAAPQSAAVSILLPCLVGWAIQFYLSAIACDRTLRILRRRNRNKLAMTPYTRPLLIVASIGNFIVGVCCIWNLGIYLLSQRRDTDFLESYKVPDVLGPGAGIPAATFTQIYMALRCWKVTEKNRGLALIMAASILTGFAGSSWATVILGFLVAQRLPTSRLFLPTVVYLVGNILADVIITVVFSMHLYRMKRVSKKSKTGNFVDSLIRLAFESCAIPTAVTVFTAIMRVVSRTSPRLNHMATATLLFIPSLYILSFIYCIEGTAARKRELERERMAQEGGGVLVANGRLNGSGNASSGAEKTRTPFTWEPPILWSAYPGQEEQGPTAAGTAARRPSVPFGDYQLGNAPIQIVPFDEIATAPGSPIAPRRPSARASFSTFIHGQRSQSQPGRKVSMTHPGRKVSVQVDSVEVITARGEDVEAEEADLSAFARELDLSPLERLASEKDP